ncbi:hypothetical protein [Leptospira wolffii]|uniref:hypothetical protein n=1 Tax=Leptospira wolffii TaxID=409998 RepID=UPI0003545E16|nr:hypothetical protein [Leptospira wolffii]EPG66507.1 hypothetical protein LEP1GSC061_1739 [Leptospira wolffii serovar Khorat str. Khorat-H2]
MSSKNSIPFREVIFRLIDKTRDGEIRWSKVPVAKIDKKRTEKDYLSDCYKTKFEGKILMIFTENILVDKDGSAQAIASLTFQAIAGITKKYPFWNRTVHLAIVDESNQILWEFPDSEIVADLLNTIQYQVAGVGDFIKRVLTEEPSNVEKQQRGHLRAKSGKKK